MCHRPKIGLFSATIWVVIPFARFPWQFVGRLHNNFLVESLELTLSSMQSKNCGHATTNSTPNIVSITPTTILVHFLSLFVWLFMFRLRFSRLFIDFSFSFSLSRRPSRRLRRKQALFIEERSTDAFHTFSADLQLQISDFRKTCASKARRMKFQIASEFFPKAE